MKEWNNWSVWAGSMSYTSLYTYSPMDSKEIKAVNPNQDILISWIHIGRTDAEAEAPILWPPDAKIWLIGKDPDAGKDWRQEKGTTEDKMVGWHYWLNRHEFEQTPGDGGGQGSLACCSPWSRKELDMTEWLNNISLWPPVGSTMVPGILSCQINICQLINYMYIAHTGICLYLLWGILPKLYS